MYTTGTEILIPPRVLPKLAEARGPLWQELVTAATSQANGSLEQIALTLMLARLNNCAACSADSYRAIHGCEICAKQTLKRFREPDEELVRLYKVAIIDVRRHLSKPSPPAN